MRLSLKTSGNWARGASWLLGWFSGAAAIAAGGVPHGYGNLPLQFQRNPGQAPSEAQFIARVQGSGLFLNAEGFTLMTRQASTTHALRVRLEGARPGLQGEGLDRQGDTQFYSGHSRRQLAGIPTYGRVQYHEVYPGVDIVYYGSQGRLEYDFAVAPGADPGMIHLTFAGAVGIHFDPAGDLLIHADGGEFRQHKPAVYQEIAGERRFVEGRYAVDSSHRIGFEVGDYDRSAPLIIDPVLSYSTFLGGAGLDQANGIAVDSAGCAYIVGETWSLDFPGATSISKPRMWDSDVFVTKLNPAGTAVLFSSFLSGSARDVAKAVALDSHGNLYITGFTLSSDFPTTSGALRGRPAGQEDAFIAKLGGTDGTLQYSSYLGGAGTDIATSIAVDASGEVYLAGYTSSLDFPVSANAFQRQFGGGFYDAFVSKVDLSASNILYSTYLGGSGSDVARGIATDSSGYAYLTGSTDSANFPLQNSIQSYGGTGDVFVTKIDSTGSKLSFSTYFGGSGADYGNAIAVGSSGIYVAGSTYSGNLPATKGTVGPSIRGGYDAFVIKIAGGTLSYCTYLGGSASDEAVSIALDASGNIHVAGYTYSSDFPTASPAQSWAGRQDAFLAILNGGSSTLLLSTYLGGAGDDAAAGLAVDAAGNAYVTGSTTSINLASSAASRNVARKDSDAFVAKFAAPVAPVPPTAVSVTPASGNGLNQTFSFQFSHPGGYAMIGAASIRIAGTDGQDCSLNYGFKDATLQMLNDSDTVWIGPVTPGSSSTLQNSRCSTNVAGVGAAGSGTTLTVTLPITFRPVFAGSKTISVQLTATNGLPTAWQQLGSWTVPQSNVPPSAVSVSPASGSGLSQTFTFQFSHPGGYSMVAAAAIRIAGTDGQDCTLYYTFPSSTLLMLNDTSTVWMGPVATGSGNSLQNSRCAITVAGVSAVGSGTILTVTLPLNFRTAFAGARTISVQLTGTNALATGLQQLGTWTVQQTNTAPAAVSVSPASGSGLSPTFTFQFSHPGGYAMVAAAAIRVAGTDGQDCTLYYTFPSSTLLLFNDTDTAWIGPVTPGSGSSLQNSRCSINVSGVTAKGSGTILTVTLPIVFRPVFTGARTLSVQLTATNGLSTALQQMGTWTVK